MRWPLYIQSDITLINILFGIILQIFYTLNKKNYNWFHSQKTDTTNQLASSQVNKTSIIIIITMKMCTSTTCLHQVWLGDGIIRTREPYGEWHIDSSNIILLSDNT